LEALEIKRAGEDKLESERIAEDQKRIEFDKALQSYREIEGAFNQYLIGKFPFSDLPKAEPFGEATPDDINAFFKVFTDKKEAATNVLKLAQSYSNTEAQLLFLKRMETVSVFFAAFLDKKQQYPAFDFNLRFRVNEPALGANHIVGGNQIIDWIFNIGGKQFLYREQNEKPPEGIWGYGKPLSLSLRWANDSPTIPADAFPPQSHMKLEGKTVTLLYDNNWSLLLLLLKHRAQSEDFPQGVDVEPYTVKFEVPTQDNPKLSKILQQAQPKSLKTTFVEVFMRVSLLTPSKKDPLVMPVFPTFAPELPNRNPLIRQRRETRSN
jgi:hypothetical protein